MFLSQFHNLTEIEIRNYFHNWNINNQVLTAVKTTECCNPEQIGRPAEIQMQLSSKQEIIRASLLFLQHRLQEVISVL